MKWKDLVSVPQSVGFLYVKSIDSGSSGHRNDRRWASGFMAALGMSWDVISKAEAIIVSP
jgi:hypothetical protein